MRSTSTQNKILKVFDTAASPWHPVFPRFSGPFWYVSARVSLYRGAGKWAFVLQRVEIDDACTNHDGVKNSIFRLSSTDNLKKMFGPFKIVCPTRNAGASNTFAQSRRDYKHYLSPDAKSIAVRRTKLKLPMPSDYRAQGVNVARRERVRREECVRALSALYPGTFFLTPSQLSKVVMPVADDGTLVLQTSEWHHPDIVDGELPSQSPSFLQFAAILAGSQNKFVCEDPNTSWKHWANPLTY